MAKPANHYFDNQLVESLVTRYVERACTDVALRDEIMGHAIPLIQGMIRSKKLGQLLQYAHHSNEDDLVAVAWQQIEKTLYKFEPGRARIFNLWTQITFTVCMAYIKKETRDAQNIRRWKTEGHPAPLFNKPKKPDFYKVMEELRETVRPEYREMVDALVDLYREDDQPWIGIIKKLSERGYRRERVREFLVYTRELNLF